MRTKNRSGDFLKVEKDDENEMEFLAFLYLKKAFGVNSACPIWSCSAASDVNVEAIHDNRKCGCYKTFGIQAHEYVYLTRMGRLIAAVEISSRLREQGAGDAIEKSSAPDGPAFPVAGYTTDALRCGECGTNLVWNENLYICPSCHEDAFTSVVIVTSEKSDNEGDN